MTSILERRVAAAQSTLDAYRDRPLVWGAHDCARLAAHALRQLGLPTPLAKFGRYSTAMGAARALKRRGFNDLGEVLDEMGFPRIPPAASLPADIFGLLAEGGGVALAVALSNGRAVGFLDLDGRAVAGVIQPHDYLAAWRVI